MFQLKPAFSKATLLTCKASLFYIESFLQGPLPRRVGYQMCDHMLAPGPILPSKVLELPSLLVDVLPANGAPSLAADRSLPPTAPRTGAGAP